MNDMISVTLMNNLKYYIQINSNRNNFNYLFKFDNLNKLSNI